MPAKEPRFIRSRPVCKAPNESDDVDWESGVPASGICGMSFVISLSSPRSPSFWALPFLPLLPPFPSYTATKPPSSTTHNIIFIFTLHSLLMHLLLRLIHYCHCESPTWIAFLLFPLSSMFWIWGWDEHNSLRFFLQELPCHSALCVSAPFCFVPFCFWPWISFVCALYVS